jgi:Tfp pilus assembly protein PilN
MRAVNLLPPDLRSGPNGPAPAAPSGEKTSGAGAFIVLGVLAFCVFAMAAYVLAGNTVKDRQAQLARATAESAAVAQKARALKPYADFESLVSSRVQTVQDLAASRFDWEQTLRDLSRAVPADVTIASIKGDLGGEAAGGGGIRSAVTAPALTLTGCTYSQTKVAQLMARLRTIDGVTRVSLSKSDKEATASAGAGVGATTDRNAPSATGYCAKGGVPAFELVVFFEGHADASTAPAPGGAAAAAASAPATGTPAATPAAGTAAPAATPAASPAASATPAPGGATNTPASATTPQKP